MVIMGSRAYDTSGSGSSLSKFFPHFSKKADRSGRESGPIVVVIGVDAPAVIEELPDIIHPGPGLSLAVHDKLVPGLRLLLDPLPVTDPADIGEIGRQHSRSLVSSVIVGIQTWSTRARAALCPRRRSIKGCPSHF